MSMHPLPSGSISHLRPRSLVVGLVILSVVLAACGGGASPTTAPTATATPTVAMSVAPTLQPASPAPTALPGLKLLWQAAGPVSGKLVTYWPAIDPVSGDIWVAASRQNQFWIFKHDGTFVEAWGIAGKGDGQFKLTTNDPSPDSVGAIAFAPDGSFFVADNGNYRVERFDKDRHFVTKWGSFGVGDGKFSSPKGVATDGSTVWVADDGGSLQAFDTTGKFLRSTTFPFVLFSRASSGHLFVADPTGVLEVDAATGNTVKHLDVTWSDLGGDSSDVVADGAGHLFAGLQSDAGPVGLVELDAGTGAVLGQWSNGAETMAISPDGKTLYLAYTGPNGTGWPYIQAVSLP